jgi:thiamine-phosphate pyrophosphorylase
VLLPLVTDETLVKRTPLLHSKTYGTGRMSARIAQPRRVEMTLDDWPGVPEMGIIAIAAGIEPVLCGANRKDVRIHHERTRNGAFSVATWRIQTARGRVERGGERVHAATHCPRLVLRPGRRLPSMSLLQAPSPSLATGLQASRAWLARRGLYVLVDPEHCAGRDPVRIAEAALRGGCSVLQLRAKRLDGGPLLALARRLRALTRAYGVPFVVNDRPDVARLADADGLHLGQDDIPVEAARRIVGDTIIGLSTHSLEQALHAVALGADLVGVGPVFPTTSKERPDPTVGIDGLREVSRTIHLPVVAIGGITMDTVSAVAAAGASLAAVVSAVCAAPDPEAAARALHVALLRNVPAAGGGAGAACTDGPVGTRGESPR